MCVDIVGVFVFKQKPAYEMRISDWSSDVCSSDLRAAVVLEDAAFQRRVDFHAGFVFGRLLDGVAVGVDQQLLVAPVDAAGPGRRHQHLAARQPVARVDDEKAQAPVGVVDQEVVDVADLARSEEHTSELQSLMRSSYAVFCLKKKK